MVNSQSWKDEMKPESSAPQREAWSVSPGICWVAHTASPKLMYRYPHIPKGGAAHPQESVCTRTLEPGGMLIVNPMKGVEDRGQGKVWRDS